MNDLADWMGAIAGVGTYVMFYVTGVIKRRYTWERKEWRGFAESLGISVGVICLSIAGAFLTQLETLSHDVALGIGVPSAILLLVGVFRHLYLLFWLSAGDPREPVP